MNEFLKRLNQMTPILEAFDMSDINLEVVTPFISPLYFQSFDIPLQSIRVPPCRLSDYPADEERVDGPTSPDDLEIYGYYLKDVYDQEASREGHDPKSPISLLVPPIRYLLFDVQTRTIYIPYDIERDELRRFLIRKFKEYPDIFSHTHRDTMKKAVDLIMSRLDCLSFAIAPSLIGRPDDQVEGMYQIVSRLKDLSSQDLSHLHLVLDTKYEYDTKERTLHLPFKGDFPIFSRVDFPLNEG